MYHNCKYYTRFSLFDFFQGCREELSMASGRHTKNAEDAAAKSTACTAAAAGSTATTTAGFPTESVSTGYPEL